MSERKPATHERTARRRAAARVRSMSAAAVLGVLLGPLPAEAQTPVGARSEAAEQYDLGVELFERAEYARAVEAFLRADELVQSSDALTSAIAAARRSNDHLLVVRDAERAIARESTDPRLAAGAREALTEAARQLARVKAECRPEPCSMSLDGKPIQAGSRYVLPGTHAFGASDASGARAEERLSMLAGSTYKLVLELTAPAGGVEQPARAAEQPPNPVSPRKPERAPAAGPPLSPAVFYAGAGITLVLAGVTTWSGLDTLRARDELPNEPTQAQIDGVESRIQRTDLLLAGSILVGAATAYAGLALVDWRGGERAAVRLAPMSGGAFASAGTSF